MTDGSGNFSTTTATFSVSDDAADIAEGHRCDD